MKPVVVAAIFARGGSRGVPRKNLRVLAGKPLLAHAIDAARASTLVDRVIVSTDDEEIADVARHYGAEVPFMRPADLARDDSPEWAAWRHAIKTLSELDWRPVDVLVSVPTSAPLRSPADVDGCVQRLLQGDADIVITVTPAARNPYFNMVTLDSDRARLVMPPAAPVSHRQAAPPVYDVTTVAYAALASYVLEAGSMFEGRVRAVVVPRERALDIDTELDLTIAEALCDRPGAPDLSRHLQNTRHGVGLSGQRPLRVRDGHEPRG